MQSPMSPHRNFSIRTTPLLVVLALPMLSNAQDANREIVLPAVAVSGQGLGEATEGTGSYTTGKSRTATC